MLTVETTMRAMVDVWLGDRKVDEAMKSRAIELKGSPPLTRTFPNWLLLSDFAPVERAALHHT